MTIIGQRTGYTNSRGNELHSTKRCGQPTYQAYIAKQKYSSRLQYEHLFGKEVHFWSDKKLNAMIAGTWKI